MTIEVREFVRLAFESMGVELGFRGQGVDEVGIIRKVDTVKFAQAVGTEHVDAIASKIGDVVVRVGAKYFRPSEVDILIGDPSKAKRELGWEPQYDLQMLVDDMMASDIKLMKKDAYLEAGGYKTLNYFE